MSNDQRGDWLVVILSEGSTGDAVYSIRCNHASTAGEIVAWFKQFNVQVMCTDDPAGDDDE
jgi:hypothetical protein